jgi:hypothetical protein
MEMEFLNNRVFIFITLILAVLRVYLECINFDFKSLPLTQRVVGENAQKFHRTGLYFSIGYIIFFAPSFLLS